MNIQAKLAVVYITLLSIGVVVISAYAIFSIRSFLLKEGIEEFTSDATTIANSFSELGSDDELIDKVNFVSELTGYHVALFGSEGQLLISSPSSDSLFMDVEGFLNDSVIQELASSPSSTLIINEDELEKLIGFRVIENEAIEAKVLRISKLKSDIYGAEASVRHLIYGAMIGSILVVIIVSIYFARYLSKPIMQLNDAALDIANGNLEREIDTNRNDEFGMLAASLNKMAGTLKADNEQLKALNEKQSQFFADITHEVRNPLHSISGSLEMLELPNLDAEKKQQYVKVAQKQIQRIVRLFEDIKSLQRYDFDESYINKEQTDLTSLIDEVVVVNKPFAEEKGLTVEVELEGSAIVMADPDKIEQVLDNLISNAIKYTNEGVIKVSCKEQAETVLVSVKDTGIGIGKEHLARLFDRFYRTDKARSRDKGGTGLGLAVVKSILNAHDSEIHVESTPGSGSIFYFELRKQA